MRGIEKDSSDERRSLVKSAQSETGTIEAEDKAIKNVLEKFSKERYYKSGYHVIFHKIPKIAYHISFADGEHRDRCIGLCHKYAGIFLNIQHGIVLNLSREFNGQILIFLFQMPYLLNIRFVLFLCVNKTGGAKKLCHWRL